MKNNDKKLGKLRRKRTSYIQSGRFWKIWPHESLVLEIKGLLDGRRDLPREREDGIWSSPHLDSEENAYMEFCTKLWGILQLENADAFKDLNTRVNKLLQARAELRQEELRLESAKEGLQPLELRKWGEDKLTEDQVRNRRRRENESTLRPFKSRIEALRRSITGQLDELSELYSRITEELNTTRLVCDKLREHTMQRMDIYWQKVLRTHSESASMPVIPQRTMTSTAEEKFVNPHLDLMEQAERLIQAKSIAEEAA